MIPLRSDTGCGMDQVTEIDTESITVTDSDLGDDVGANKKRNIKKE